MANPTVTDDIPADDFRSRASALLKKAFERQGTKLSTAGCRVILDAIEEDLRTLAADAAITETRLLKLALGRP